MIRLPVTYYMRRRDLIETFGKLGISAEEIDKAIKSKVLAGQKFTGETARSYYRAQMAAEKFGLGFEISGAECIIFSAPTQTTPTPPQKNQ